MKKKVRRFYLYGDEKTYKDKVCLIKEFVRGKDISIINPFQDAGYLAFVELRCTKKTWKELKFRLNLCKIWS